MKRSVSISTALLLSAAAFACTKKNTGMEGNNNSSEPQTQTAPETTTPGATTPSDTTGTMGTTPSGTTDTGTGTSLNQPTNCPDPSAPGYDASKVDPACATGTPGTTTTPTTPSDANTPTTTP